MANGVTSSYDDVVELHDLFVANGFTPVLEEVVYTGGPNSETARLELVPVPRLTPSISLGTVSQRNNDLVAAVAFAAGPHSLSASLPGYPLEGEEQILAMRAELGTFGGTSEWRAMRFASNQVELDEKLAALPNPPDSASQVEAIEIQAFQQVELLLNIDVDKRSKLWSIMPIVEGGWNPRLLFGDNSAHTPLESQNQFSDVWNSSTKAERLQYLGIDPIGWDLALSHLTLSQQMDNIQDDLEDWVTPLLILGFAIGIGWATGGLATHAYAAYFAVPATSFGAVATGAAVGAYSSTFFLTGSTSQAEKAAWGALLSAGISHLTAVPIVQRTDVQILTLAILEGGIASLEGENFRDALLKSLARQYIPGVATFVESLDNTAPFLVDLGEVMIISYIENDGDWDEIAEDLQDFTLQEAGDFVEGYSSDLLPAAWGEFGTALGEVAGIAVSSGGNPDSVRGAVATRFANLTVGFVFENDESLFADVSREVLTTYVATAHLPESERAREIDRRMTSYLFGLAAETLADTARSTLVDANGGQSSALIDGTADLIDVAVSNLWRDQDDLEQLLLSHLGNELSGAISSSFPGCAPAWLTSLGSQMIDSVIDDVIAGNTDAINSNLVSLVNSAASQGSFPGGIGTCHEAVGGGEASTGEQRCSDPDEIPLSASVGTQLCAEDGVRIYFHAAQVWAVVGTNEVRLQDNDGVSNGFVEVPAGVFLPAIPWLVQLLVPATGLGALVILVGPHSDDVVVTDGIRRWNYAEPEDAAEQFPTDYFEGLSASVLNSRVTEHPGNAEFERIYAFDSNLRLAVRANAIGELQIRSLFSSSWTDTGQLFLVLLGGPSGNDLVGFEAIDTATQGLENRNSQVDHPVLETTSARARRNAQLPNEDEDEEWEAHHVIPMSIIILYQDMFIDAVESNLVEPFLTQEIDGRGAVVAGGVITDAVSNLMALPANEAAQQGHLRRNNECLPLHGWNADHVRWTADVEADVESLHAEWEDGRGDPGFWERWSRDILQIQNDSKARIRADGVGRCAG